MLHVSDLQKYYADHLVFQKVSFDLNRGDRVGLVGPNGCGKTTLLRILVGDEQPDAGSVRYSIPRTRVGYLPQALEYDEGATVRELMSGVEFLTEEQLLHRVETLASEMATAPTEHQRLLEHRYAQAIERLSGAGSYLPDHEIARVLAGLGLDRVAPETPVEQLSGGQKTRLGLARLLLTNPELLLLDEPTNHLDIAALEWLEAYLRAFGGGLLLVSHDRTFLDRVATQILEMDPRRAVPAGEGGAGEPQATTRTYPGDYSAYAQAKASEEENYRRAYKDQQDRLARLQEAADALRNKARRVEKETINFHYRKIAKKMAREGVVRQKRIERLMNSEEYLERPELTYQMKLEFLETPRSGQDVVILHGLGKWFDDLILFRGVDLVLRRGERVALLGPNGAGKTTLLRIITGEEPASEGEARLGAGVRVGYLSQGQETLDPVLTPLEHIRRVAPLSETQARTFLHYYLFAGDDVFVPIGSLSFGERARLAMGSLVLTGCNLLLLDEPINHLDLPSRERFERALSQYEGTVLAVVHDRYFVQRFATGVWAVGGGTVKRYVDLEDMRRGQGLGDEG